MRKLLILLTLLLVSVVSTPGRAATERPFEAGMYISLYGVDSAWWGMSPQNPQYRAYSKTDFAAILSRIKADGFDNIYVLPGDWTGQRVMWKTQLPFLQTKSDWTQLKRDMMEELLSAADKNHQKVYLCLLRMDLDAKWWKKAFPDQAWFDDKDQFANAFVRPAEMVSIPAMREIVRKYGRHPSLVGFGVDEILYSGRYFDKGISDSVVGYEARELYRKRFNEEPPSLDPYPARIDARIHRLFDCREEIMTQYHQMLSDACKEERKEYTTTLNTPMLGKITWKGLGGELAAYGTDPWRIAMLSNNSEVALDFYASYMNTHIQADMTKFITSPVYGKPMNLVLGTQFGGEIMAKHLIDTLAEGVDRITYWTNYYYYGDHPKPGLMSTKADPERVSYLVKAAKEFRKRVPVHPKYDVAILVNRLWQRDHFRSTDPRENEISQMGYAVDQLNMAGYRYDIVGDEEAAAGGLSGIPAVVVPLGAGITERALDILESYLDKGGRLIVSPDLGTKTPWGDAASARFARRVKSLLERPRVVRLPQLLGDSVTAPLARILAENGIPATSPLVLDNAAAEFSQPTDYDVYWGPRPKFPVNGRIYDLFWSGTRYQALSLGYRENWSGRPYRLGRFSVTLKPYQNLIMGKCNPSGDYDLLLVNNSQPVEVFARKVFVYGKDGRWSEMRAESGKASISLQGPTLVRIP